MAKSALGRRTFTYFMALVMAVSTNVPVAAFASDVSDTTETAAEQPQTENASGGFTRGLT